MIENDDVLAHAIQQRWIAARALQLAVDQKLITWIQRDNLIGQSTIEWQQVENSDSVPE